MSGKFGNSFVAFGPKGPKEENRDEVDVGDKIPEEPSTINS